MTTGNHAISGRINSASSPWFRFTLLSLVFCSGIGVMGLEMTASQLIAPYFGSTISIWTSLIGLVMVFLTTGYYLGGALADRRPSRVVLGGLVLVAGLSMLVMPLLSKPILMAVWQLTPKIGLLPSALIGTFILLCIPNVLLGCVCPFAMKLSIQDLASTGRASGNIYAISAIGSVIGTFLPALLTIQLFGVRRSIMFFGALLVLAALLLLSRLRFSPAAAALLLLALPLSPMLPTRGLIAEKETPYNYLQVVQAGPARLLIVDWGAFSFYTPGQFRTGQYYDYLMLAPLMRPEPPKTWLHNMLVIGLGAGTISKQATQAFGPIAIDGVEIDPGIVDLGREYFDMKEANLKVYETDGRAFLATAHKPYDWVVVDAYQGSDIPFHLITKEFFQQLKSHMSPNGVVSINVAWWKEDDTELLQELTATVKTVFPTVCAVTAIGDSSAVLLAGGKDASPNYIKENAQQVGRADLREIVDELGSPNAPRIEFPTGLGEPFTDDRTVVDKIVDRMYLKARQEAYAREKSALTP